MIEGVECIIQLAENGTLWSHFMNCQHIAIHQFNHTKIMIKWGLLKIKVVSQSPTVVALKSESVFRITDNVSYKIVKLI